MALEKQVLIVSLGAKLKINSVRRLGIGSLQMSLLILVILYQFLLVTQIA